MALEEALREKREEICLAHMAAENTHEFEAAIGFFAHPRYELLATGDVYEALRSWAGSCGRWARCGRGALTPLISRVLAAWSAGSRIAFLRAAPLAAPAVTPP